MYTSPKSRIPHFPKTWKKILLGLGAAALCAVFALIVWIAIPPRKVPCAALLPSRQFAYFTVRLDRDDPATMGIISALKERFASRGGFVKRHAASLAIPSLLPPAVTAALGVDPEGDGGYWVLYADVGRISKVVRLAGSAAARSILGGAGPLGKTKVDGTSIWFRSGGGLSAYAVCGGTLVLGSSREAVSDCCRRHARETAGEPRSAWREAVEKAMDSRGAFFFADNRPKDLSRFVEKASAKHGFAAFPSIDSVSGINLSAALTAEEIIGKVSFSLASRDRAEAVASDVRFIYGAARRVARSSGMKLQGEVRSEEGAVALEFHLPGYLEAVRASSKK